MLWFLLLPKLYIDFENKFTYPARFMILQVTTFKDQFLNEQLNSYVDLTFLIFIQQYSYHFSHH